MADSVARGAPGNPEQSPGPPAQRDELASRAWMFCPFTGNMLEFDDANDAAVCRHTGFSRSYDAIDGFTVVHRTKMADFRGKYDLDPLVKDYEFMDPGAMAARQTTQETCINCGWGELEFFTMQLRSADEGQTVFFECPKCKHKWRQNN